MTLATRLGGVALAALATGGLVALSDGTLHGPDSHDGLLRLSWRAVGRRVEECRAPTATELEALPPHMRPERICEGRLEPFDLTVRIDGETVIEREVRPAGAREDRPTYVFDEVRLAPGSHRLEVVFAEAPGGASPPLRLETSFELPPRGVRLVTRDSQHGALELVSATPGAEDRHGESLP